MNSYFASNRWMAAIAVVVFAATSATVARAEWTTFVIRNGASGAPGIFDNNDYGPPAKEFVIAEGGQKAGWGTSSLDGLTVGDITQLSITRYDDPARFSAGSGPAVAPYFNIWVTDGNGKFAVIGNEPSNPSFQDLYNNGYDLSFNDISGEVAKAYENSDLSWLPNNGVGMTFGDLANFTIQAPTVDELTTGWAGLGTGAPRVLGTNEAFGFNWVLGDTLSSYVSGDEGYVLGNPVAVPEPASVGLASLALLGLASLARRRRC